MDIAAFRRALLGWFDEHARDLPWREPRTLYGTLVSECMLQQTRVTTVLPYFARWMRRFPTLASLAVADEADVLKHWEGLGYYRRARNLQRLAIELENLPKPPQTAADWLSLPGIGPYTAAAVASQVFGEAAPCVDGNMVRVFARLTADPTVFRDASQAARTFQGLAEALIDPDRPGAWNEAMMELGATVCTRTKPACLTCPLRPFCRAGQQANPENFPRLAARKRRNETVDRIVCVRQRPKSLLLQAGEGRWEGILELPSRTLIPGLADLDPFAERRRSIGQTDYRERLCRVARSELPRKMPEPCRWVPVEKLDSVTLSGPHRRWIRELLGY